MSHFSQRNDTSATCVSSDWRDRHILFITINRRIRTALIAFNSMLILLTLFLNILSLVTIRKSPQLKNKLCYFVIQVQSAVDVAVGGLSIPALLVLLVSPFWVFESCLAFRLLFVSMLAVPSCHPVTLLTLTVERYIGVIHPYLYQTILTREIILLFGIVACSLCVVSVSLLFFGGVLIALIFGLLILAFFVFITYAYSRIYLVVRQLDDSGKRPADSGQPNNASRRRRLFREINHAKSCFIVVIAYCIVLLPLAFAAIFLANGVNRGVYVCWLHSLLMLNSSINSVTFFWTKKLLRTEAWKVIRSIFSQSQF